MSNGRAQLEASLASLHAELAQLRSTIDVHVGMELQEWRQQAERRVLPEGYTVTDKRWANPSMTSGWQEDELARRKAELHRKYEPSIARLEGKIARIQRMLGLEPVQGADPDHTGVIHPTVTALANRVAEVLPIQERSWFPTWLARNGAHLNATVQKALGDRLQIVELFAGIGGLGSGLEAALNGVTILQAERVPERRQVLERWFPLAHKLDDVHQFLDFFVLVLLDRLVVVGGFPCRGASRANIHGTLGMANPETGLWSVMAEVVRKWRPIAVVTENVLSLRSRGLSIVLRDLVNADYDVIWGRLDASDFGAPHQRARLFCVGIRRDSSPLTITPRPHRAAWLPWASEIPANDHRAPTKKARVAALGDSVVPIVAYTVGLTAARLLGGWRPDRSILKPASLDELPTNGWIERDRVFALKDSPYQPTTRVADQRWVVFDERFQSPTTPLECCTYPPGLGRITWWDGISDNVDIELPGGEVMPVPPEWVRHGPWPTAVACDAKNLGARGQFERNAPGLNALVQTDSWIAEDGLYCPELLEQVFGGRGIGPAFLEWTLGFPPGWTTPMIATATRPRAVERSRRAA